MIRVRDGMCKVIQLGWRAALIPMAMLEATRLVGLIR